MGRGKGVSRRSKVGTGNNTRPRKTPIDNRQHASSLQKNGSVSLETTSPSTTHVGHAHVNEEVAVG